MSTIDEQGRPEPPPNADERATLLGFLDFQRATFAWKTQGLDSSGLSVSVGDSSMTLGGMLKYLAWVEQYWFAYFLHDRTPEAPWKDVDWEADRDWDWNSAAEDSPDQLYALWNEAVARSGQLVDEALADGGVSTMSAKAWPDGTQISLRWMLCHMIEEDARHNGHADLIRETIDGLTGE
ncbi:DinB family protein [Natronoglycomyces albus]|uniref:DinB family protein n=1 Tax=Natronoglycomyces albus TaxID=2811108 RepID=A0A895XGB2_9ACTN|nr:DinB family protein [Natronoglycomyces albus]QSB04901.1 DinB family protein [Natronoglycomyces albus]